jgi:hypothetical protein
MQIDDSPILSRSANHLSYILQSREEVWPPSVHGIDKSPLSDRICPAPTIPLTFYKSPTQMKPTDYDPQERPSNGTREREAPGSTESIPKTERLSDKYPIEVTSHIFVEDSIPPSDQPSTTSNSGGSTSGPEPPRGVVVTTIWAGSAAKCSLSTDTATIGTQRSGGGGTTGG